MNYIDLKYFESNTAQLFDQDLLLPPSITHFVWNGTGQSMFYTFFNRTLPYNRTIKNIIINTNFCGRLFRAFILPFIQQQVPSISELTICRHSLLTLAPFLSSLTSLTILQYSGNSNFTELYTSELPLLPITVPITILEIGTVLISSTTPDNFFLPLLSLPQLSNLKYLYCDIHAFANAEKFGHSYENGTLGITNVALWNCLNRIVEFCDNRGVKIIFQGKNVDEVMKIKRKIMIYERRQSILDAQGR